QRSYPQAGLGCSGFSRTERDDWRFARLLTKNNQTRAGRHCSFAREVLNHARERSGTAMLIQLPSGSPAQPGPQNADQESTTFEAGLRRDLASSPIVSYDAMLGGPAKRAIDLVLALVTAPLWIPLTLVAAGVSKLRDRSPVFLAQ